MPEMRTAPGISTPTGLDRAMALTVKLRLRAREAGRDGGRKTGGHTHPSGSGTGRPAGKLRNIGRRRTAVMALSAGAMGLAAFTTQPNENQKQTAHASPFMQDLRQNAASMTTSESFKEALVQEEGVRLTVYRDVAGYPTVGVGHLVTPADNLSVGQRISYDQVIQFLEADLAKAEAAVARLVGGLALHQHEFDALVDLVYNVGEGNVSEAESPRLNAAIQAGDYVGIARELDYTHAGGQVAGGLVNRSERRMAIFMDANYEDPRLA
ncbi:lysozyme [Pseudopontixanthobacter vadosimaris]|uniref:lysozyme n=1 Tax=Pseudopontixanthobacter vadosimaris TaxID=2726450 RepID=UPI001F0EC151|nr:lysozyme [Pseudopontixanthobacter vadosimaris]